ncbi:MAG: sel1 repeat family protein [Alphaproteobacteria bacterium]|nr:sel1 repeat family protein [Alphaproteobacteria bacterium]
MTPATGLALAMLLTTVALADLAADCAAGAPQGQYAACQQALDAAPHDVRLKRLLALGMLLGGAEETAILAYRHLSEQSPEDADAHFQLAVAYGTVREFRNALAPLDRALALDPAHRDASRLSVIAHQQLGQFADAVPHLLRLAEAGDEIAMYELAVALERGAGLAANSVKAVHWFAKAAEAGHVAALDRLAEAYFTGQLGLRPDNARGNDYATQARDARRGQLSR